MSGHLNFRPSYESYRDERRDPRIRSADVINRRYSGTSDEPSHTPATIAKRGASPRPSNDDERGNGLREVQDEHNHGYSRKVCGELPASITKVRTKPSIVQTHEKSSVSR